ncbi:tubulin delta 1 [Phyllostomus discolor]|uniref:Tubulin delta 1 n=1 Tax=Phyllostomus discolor TaxID=89673 RepID=A0A833ZQC7_9CHIR|nr:tubulin delta 1 [Phyllostomus discolor]
MSIVTVQLGQCGNQIGFEVFDALFSDSHCTQGLCSKRENEAYRSSCKERFFNEEENGGIDWQVQPPLSRLPTLGKRSLSEQLRFNTSIANLVVLRGKDVHSADVAGFKDPALYTSWLGPDNAFNVWKTQRAFSKYEKSAALVSNSQFLVKPLDMIVSKAWNMFASKAYIHQYTKFGIEEEDFLDSFTLLEQVVASYCNL